MISWAAGGWLVASLLTGVVHLLGIHRASQQPQGWEAALGMLRLVGVGAVLTTAAIWGYLFPAVAGWLVGFAASLTLAWKGRS